MHVYVLRKICLEIKQNVLNVKMFRRLRYPYKMLYCRLLGSKFGGVFVPLEVIADITDYVQVRHGCFLVFPINLS